MASVLLPNQISRDFLVKSNDDLMLQLYYSIWVIGNERIVLDNSKICPYTLLSRACQSKFHVPLFRIKSSLPSRKGGADAMRQNVGQSSTFLAHDRFS
jgi:hypothetical protein